MRRSSRQGLVNLARRPFVNRRPILRLAALMWLLGIGLLLVNVKLYAGYWRGKAMNDQRLGEINLELTQQRQELSTLDLELRRVNLGRQNRQTNFLNSLITYRTFPWSSLFDDLEEVLPRQVRLLSVTPAVNLVSGAEKPPPRRPRRGRSRASAGAGEDGKAAAPEAAPAPLKRNEVSLLLSAVAENEDALYELINTLYASSSFRWPDIPGEKRNLESGSTSFSVSVIYLTRPDESVAEEPALAEDASDPAAGPDEIVFVSPEDEAPTREEPEAVAAEPQSEEAGVVAVERKSPAVPNLPESAASRAAAGTEAPAAARSSAARRPAAPSPAAGRSATARSLAGLPSAVPPAAARAAAAAGATPRPSNPEAGRPAAVPPPATPPPTDEPPATDEPPPTEEPPFVEPAASSTPRVRTGSLLAFPGDPPWPRARDLEVAT